MRASIPVRSRPGLKRRLRYESGWPSVAKATTSLCNFRHEWNSCSPKTCTRELSRELWKLLTFKTAVLLFAFFFDLNAEGLQEF